MPDSASQVEVDGAAIEHALARSNGRHITRRFECGAVTYALALAEGCSLLDGPARVRG
jgi:hypothetical protein